MNYTEALEYIHGTYKFGKKLGLHNIAMLLELMGDPHKKLKFVHVAGTNGKGSTSAYISSILKNAGYTTGLFTSPFLERFTERMRVGDDEISEDDLSRITAFVKDKVDIMLERGENHPTEFEVVTAIAMQYYYEKNCDVVVLEVGLGGRFDPTNVIDTPLLSVITTISLDHTDRLGDTLEKIAFEKAGIIKPGGHVLIYPQEPQAMKVFEEICSSQGASLYKADFSSLKSIEYGVDGQTFDFAGYKGLKISLLGDHQLYNAALAVKAAELLRNKGMAIDEGAIRKGLERTQWPGRLEVLHKEPLFIVDGAHNAEGARVLAQALEKYFPRKRKIFIVGMMKDKKCDEILSAAAPLASRIITVRPDNKRAVEAEELAELAGRYCKNVTFCDTIIGAVETSLQASDRDDLICAFGSLYYLGEIRAYFRNTQQQLSL